MSNGIASARNVLNLAAVAAVTGLIVSIAAVPTRAPGAATPAAENRPDEARYQIDVARRRIWLLTRDGVFVTDPAEREKIELRLPDWQWAAAPYGSPPDLALGPNGEAVITSNVLPTLWRVDPDTFAVSVHPLELDADADKDIGFFRLIYSSEQGAFFALADHHGSVWKIDPRLTTARKLPRSEPIPNACLRPARTCTHPVSGGRSCVTNSHPFIAARGC